MTNLIRVALLIVGGVLLINACGGQQGPDEREAQSITFAELPARSERATPFAVAASATSGLAVAFEAAGVCAVDGVMVTLTGMVGDCTITASQTGNADYLPAPDVARSFAVITDVYRVGFVLVTETGPAHARMVDASGNFETRVEPVTDLLASAPLGGRAPSCVVNSVLSGGPGDPVLPDPDPTATPIHAGTPLILRHDGASFASLVSQ